MQRPASQNGLKGKIRDLSTSLNNFGSQKGIQNVKMRERKKKVNET